MTEEINNDILNLTDDDIENMSPKEVKEKISRAMKDPDYLDGHSPFHSKKVNMVSKLYAVITDEPEPEVNKDGEPLTGQPWPEGRKLYQEAVKEREAKQQKQQKMLVEVGKDYMRQLGKLNIPTSNIPDDVTADEVELLKMKLLHTEAVTGNEKSWFELLRMYQERFKKEKHDNKWANDLLAVIRSGNPKDAMVMDISHQFIEYFFNKLEKD